MMSLAEQRVAALQHFHKLGYTLRDCMHPRRLGGVQIATLHRVASKAGILFPDMDEVAKEIREAKRR
jgi:hypothetical protein